MNPRSSKLPDSAFFLSLGPTARIRHAAAPLTRFGTIAQTACGRALDVDARVIGRPGGRRCARCVRTLRDVLSAIPSTFTIGSAPRRSP